MVMALTRHFISINPRHVTVEGNQSLQTSAGRMEICIYVFMKGHTTVFRTLSRIIKVDQNLSRRCLEAAVVCVCIARPTRTGGTLHFTAQEMPPKLISRSLIDL